jgi:Concanavalin A-like lectin/glucanases superfamily
MPMLGLTAADQIVGQSWNSVAVAIIGPNIILGVWTHIAISYSLTTGFRLWVNGVLIGTSGLFTYAAANMPAWITVGLTPAAALTCARGSISIGQFYGMIDEMKVYSRELTAAEVLTLANP